MSKVYFYQLVLHTLKIFGCYFVSLVQSYAVLPAMAKISYAISYNGSVLTSAKLKKICVKRPYPIYFNYLQVNDLNIML